MLAQDLSHVEVDALLEPKVPWKDPFQVRVAALANRERCDALDFSRVLLHNYMVL